MTITDPESGDKIDNGKNNTVKATVSSGAGFTQSTLNPTGRISASWSVVTVSLSGNTVTVTFSVPSSEPKGNNKTMTFCVSDTLGRQACATQTVDVK